MKTSAALLLPIALVLICATVAAHDTTKADAAFRQLASLVGEWQGIQDGVPIRVMYTLIGNGSALMEQVLPGDSAAMVTMFTVDSDHLIATHYCAARNQPQMVSGVPGDLHSGVTFAFVRVTGMKTPGDWHNTELTFTLEDADHITQRWRYAYKGKTGTSVFHYTRMTQSPR